MYKVNKFILAKVEKITTIIFLTILFESVSGTSNETNKYNTNIKKEINPWKAAWGSRNSKTQLDKKLQMFDTEILQISRYGAVRKPNTKR